MLGFVSVKELKEEQRMAIKAFVNGRDLLLYVCVCLVPVLANRCVMEVYLRKLPVVFDILNGQHEHELGTLNIFSRF